MLIQKINSSSQYSMRVFFHSCLPHGGHLYLSSNLAQAAGPFVKTYPQSFCDDTVENEEEIKILC
jgi:hypothetical protein